MGIVDGSANWPDLDTEELVYLAFSLISVVAGIAVGISRSTWLRWPILGWTGLALISSNWVWDFGNNAARAFAPLAVLVVLSFGHLAEGTGDNQQSGRSHLRRSELLNRFTTGPNAQRTGIKPAARQALTGYSKTS